MSSVKRSADTNQQLGDDAIAVCMACSRTSNDLTKCDKCGSSLSADNTAHCYSAEPKRSCTEPSVQSMPSSSGTNGQSKSPEVATSDSSVRPQALYVNVNNQAFPVIRVGSVPSTTCALVTTQPVSLTAVVGTPPATCFARYQNGTLSLPHNSSSSLVASAAVGVRQSSGMVAAVNNGSVNSQWQELPVSQMTLPSFNLQPPPPPFATNVTRLPGIVSGSAQSAVIPPSATPSGASLASSHSVNAVQIRIGSKKFKPSTPVAFKEDGILFTLKDYTYAPVLLNARAILKCKANLSTFSYPVLFLFLESSCMRQIRNIFGLSANEFSHTSPVEMRRCISIFPVFGIEGKSQVQTTMYAIKRAFEAMVRRYPRSSSILEDISNDQTIDILLDLGSAENGTRNENSSSETVDGDVQIPLSSNSTELRSPVVSQINVVSTPTFAQHQGVNGAISAVAPPTPSVPSSMSAASFGSATVNNITAAEPQPNRMPSAPPLLQVPSDQARWQAMQKSLVANGVYHVLMPQGQRQYCLWNGKQLVPCLVQNTEVQLQGVKVRIGSLFAECVGQIRVKTDQTSGIFFTIKSDHCGTQEIAIAPMDIQSCQLCFGEVAVLFILLNNNGAERMRKRLRLSTSGDPAYDAYGPVHLRYVILFIRQVNRDQEDALRQMKFNRSGSPNSLLEVIDVSKGIHLLAQIKLSTTTVTAEEAESQKIEQVRRREGHASTMTALSAAAARMRRLRAAETVEQAEIRRKIDKLRQRKRRASSVTEIEPVAAERSESVVSEFLKAKDINGKRSFEKLANDVAASATSGIATAADDDDDDVIMTQEEIGIKCPYTQQVMKNPVRNVICGHNYESAAILEFIARKKGNARCPYAGCGNLVPLRTEDLTENVQLRDYISKTASLPNT